MVNGMLRVIVDKVASVTQACGLSREVRISAEIPAEVTRAGSIMHVHVDGAAEVSLHLALLLNGVYATPRGMINLSTALTAADLDAVGAAYETAFGMISGG